MKVEKWPISVVVGFLAGELLVSRGMTATTILPAGCTAQPALIDLEVGQRARSGRAVPLNCQSMARMIPNLQKELKNEVRSRNVI